jgi:hypothetical protein
MAAETAKHQENKDTELKEATTVHLSSKRTSGRIFQKNIRLQIAKGIAGLRKIRDWTLLRGRPLPKRKKSLLPALS